MTATARRAGPAALRSLPAARVFTAATTVLLVHALDDALLHRQPGVGAGQHALAAVLALTLGLAGILAFSFLRPGLRAGLAFAFGGLGLVNGGLHVLHVVREGPADSDLTGLLAAAAGSNSRAGIAPRATARRYW